VNERIRELEKQATETVKCGLNGTSTAEVFNRKKFAELIIRECSELTLDYKNDQHYQGWLDYRNEIKKHFGVE
jgi:hypothetical protein